MSYRERTCIDIVCDECGADEEVSVFVYLSQSEALEAWAAIGGVFINGGRHLCPECFEAKHSEGAA